MSKMNLKELRWMLNYWLSSASPHRILRTWLNSLSAWRRFWISYREYQTLVSTRAGAVPEASIKYLYPCVHDASATTVIEPIYFYQDAWAFEHITRQRPAWHVDVGSHHKYVALLSKIVPVTMVDIRPLSLPLDTLVFRAGSILDLPYEDETVPSLSSLCVLEHIGLGRYGDPLNPDGTVEAVQELKRVVAPGSDLYVSVPLDVETRTYFNAHRAFLESDFLSFFRNSV
jgi:hypothetical protein